MTDIIVVDTEGRLILFQKDMARPCAWSEITTLWNERGIHSIEIRKDKEKR
jgi:hypothetical protein